MKTRSLLIRSGIVLTLASPAGLMVGADAAHAVTVVQRCGSLTGSATITPGLTSVPANQTIVASGPTSGCTPAAATGGSGRFMGTIKLNNVTCTSLVSAQTLPGNGKVTWKDGTVSTFTFSGKTTAADPTLATLTGKVKSGKFVGNSLDGKIRFTPVFTGTGTPCSPTNPLKKITFTNKISSTQTVPLRFFH